MKKKKAHSLTMSSVVRTLAIKCYDEQLPDGWEQTKTIIQNMDKKCQVIAIKHDKDTNKDDIWEPSAEKPHYHIIIKSAEGKLYRVSQLLKALGVVYRKGTDDLLWDEHGVETVGDYAGYTAYLTHETDQAMLDGKYKYDRSELISNLTPAEIDAVRDGYTRLTKRKVGVEEMAELDEQAYKIGYELKDFNKWYDSLTFYERSHSKMKTVKESYNRGVDARAAEGTAITRVCIYIQGAPNSGKTYAAQQALKGHKTLMVGGGGSGKFDNLQPSTDAIIIDDDICPNILNMSDNYICRAYRRNSNNPYWAGRYLIITSNLDFCDYVEQCGIKATYMGNKTRHLEALESRFYICNLAEGEQGIYLNCISPSRRGSPEEQTTRKDLYISFRDEFEKSLRSYQYMDKIEVDYSDLNTDKPKPSESQKAYYQMQTEEWQAIVDDDDLPFK